MSSRVCIVVPVYNDWVSFEKLVSEIGSALKSMDCSVEILAVDDCSSSYAPDFLPTVPPIKSVTVMRLVTNLGHQRAIAIGLVHVAARTDLDVVAIMDADGEDRPDDLRHLLSAADTYPGTIALAERTRRSEGLRFRLFYYIYILVFKLLTSHNLKFGNFSAMPYLEQLITRPDTWNNYAASVIRSRLPIRPIPTCRSTRYAGESSMNFISLIIHGFGAMSVFSDVVLVRLLFASLSILAGTIAGVAILFYIRLFTMMAVPGWASNVFGFLMLMAFNSVMLTVTTVFLQLNRRSTSQRHPGEFALSYIKSIITLNEKRPV